MLAKKIFLTTLLALVFTGVLQSQEDGYKKIWNNSMWSVKADTTSFIIPPPPAGFKQFNGQLTHFRQGSENPYIVLDNYNTKKQYTAFNTGISQVSPLNWAGSEYIINSYYSDAILKARNGLLFIGTPGIDPVFKRFVGLSELPGYNHQNQWNVFSGFWSHPVGDWYHYYTDAMYLYKSNTQLTELQGKWLFPGKFRISALGQFIIPSTNSLWLTNNNNSTEPGLIEFDIVNEEWIIWDSTNLPIRWFSECMYDDLQNNKLTSFYYFVSAGFQDWDAYNPKPIIPIFSYYKNEGSYYTDNALLYFNRTTNQFDTINLNTLEGTPFWGDNPDKYVLISARRLYGFSNNRKIHLNWSVPFDWQGVAPLVSKYIMLYDWDTREIEIIPPPADTLFTFHNIWGANNFHIVSIDAFSNDECDRCLGILYVNGDFFVYNPVTSVTERLESIPDLWFRNIYPNPATSKITANIMCYLSTVSDVDIGLYDFMGQKVLDLSNQFEYEPATATIHISFDIPKSLSKGSYFLVVRSGKETRTQGIIVK
jgi:hypothetical protein